MTHSSQPPFLFPANSQLGRDNLVLHASARRHTVQDFAGPLSIKTVIRGEAAWIVGGRALQLDSNTFLVLADGDRYSMDIDSASPVETCCVFFRDDFVEQMAFDQTTTLQSALDEPWRKGPCLEFLSRLHCDWTRRILRRVWSLAETCERQIQPSGLEEEFLLLANALLLRYREIRDQMARLPAAKASTRRELFRRLELAREYIHANSDRRLSLEELGREAGVSRYHLHRSFRAVVGATPHAYITMLRLARAILLLERGKSVTEAAMDVGFSSASSFTRLFRSRYGFPPSSVAKFRKIGQA